MGLSKSFPRASEVFAQGGGDGVQSGTPWVIGGKCQWRKRALLLHFFCKTHAASPMKTRFHASWPIRRLPPSRGLREESISFHRNTSGSPHRTVWAIDSSGISSAPPPGRRGHRLLVCGHSLGGAIASLVTLRLLDSQGPGRRPLASSCGSGGGHRGGGPCQP